MWSLGSSAMIVSVHAGDMESLIMMPRSVTMPTLRLDSAPPTPRTSAYPLVCYFSSFLFL
eukprot:749029-Hanusia_phi.AAC.1